MAIHRKRNFNIYSITISISIIFLIISFFWFKVFQSNHSENVEPINKTTSSQYEKGQQNESEIKYKKDLSLIHKRNRQNKLKRNFINLLDSSDLLKSINQTLYEKMERWKNDSYPYMGIERFAIPMISTISAGKSSSLNYILNFNILQIRENVTTKFCLLIRDNKKYKKGKIFTVTVEKRAEVNKFNFKKGKLVDDDPKKFVEERNKLIQNLKGDAKDIGLYFFLLEIDTGLFEGEYEKYSSLIEFIDIPGLNENGLESNFYFRNIIPFIKPNFLFPIIILDAKKFYSTDVFEIFKEIFSPYSSKNMEKNKYDFENQNYILQKNKNNSLFLINKLNLFQNEERAQMTDKILKETSKSLNIEISLNSNIFIINAKAKNLEINKYDSFLNYVEYIFNKGDLIGSNKVLNIIIKEFNKDFNYTKPSNLNEEIKSFKYQGAEDEYKIFKELVEIKKYIIGRFSKENYHILRNIPQINKKIAFFKRRVSIINFLEIDIFQLKRVLQLL